MSVVTCPLCGHQANGACHRCPECSADLGLDRDAAFDELLARSGPLSLPLSARPVGRRLLTRRRRAVLLTLAVVLAVLLSCPLWAGYFGPRAAVYATYWRPWRTNFQVTYSEAYTNDARREVHWRHWPQFWAYWVSYTDRFSRLDPEGWPPEHDYVIVVKHRSPHLPWRVAWGSTGG